MPHHYAALCQAILPINFHSRTLLQIYCFFAQNELSRPPFSTLVCPQKRLLPGTFQPLNPTCLCQGQESLFQQSRMLPFWVKPRSASLSARLRPQLSFASGLALAVPTTTTAVIQTQPCACRTHHLKTSLGRQAAPERSERHHHKRKNASMET